MRTVYATTLSFESQSDIEAVLSKAANWIKSWYRRHRLEVEIPDLRTDCSINASPLNDHLIRIQQHFSSEASGSRLICIEWRYPDQYDDGLRWTTNISMLLRGRELLFSLEIAVAGSVFRVKPAEIRLGAPRLIKELSVIPSVRLAGYPYSLTPETITADLVDLLCDALCDKSRPFPIVVVSRDIASELPLVDSEELAANLAGLAKVYELADRWAAFRLTEEVEKERSCFGGAVRTYWPGFSRVANPFNHPLVMPWSIREMPDPSGLSRMLFRIYAETAAFRHSEPLTIIAFRDRAEAEHRASIIAASSRDPDELLAELVEAEEELEVVKRKLRESEEENAVLKANFAALSGSFAELPADQRASNIDPDDGDPESVIDAVARARATLQNIEILESADQSAKESPYKQPARVLQALQAIDEVSDRWAKSLRGGSSIGSMRQIFKSLGFEYKDDVSQTSRGKWGSEYSSRYKGRDVDISPHITIGAKAADTCISIHLFWDEEIQKAVIAHVGRHKTNTKS